MGTSPGHYWVQQLMGKLAECRLTSPLMQGMCLAVVAVVAVGAVAAAAVVAEENKTNLYSQTQVYSYINIHIK